MFLVRMTFAAALALSAPLAAHAADHQVLLKNQGAGGQMMVFEPSFLQVAPGDTVHFVPADPGHNVETIPGMLPAGATPLKSEAGKPYDVTFTAPGLYGLRCRPHYAMGMVGVIVVGGKPANLGDAQAVSTPGMAKQRMDGLLVQAASVSVPKAGKVKRAAKKPDHAA